MRNSETNRLFLDGVDKKTRNLILKNIASHYRISTNEALEEVTDNEAEHLLDYVTGQERAACNLLMKKYGF